MKKREGRLNSVNVFLSTAKAAGRTHSTNGESADSITPGAAELSALPNRSG